MKLKRTAVVFASLALVLAVSGILLNADRSAETVAEEIRPVTDIGAADVQAIMIANKSSQLIIYNSRDGLIIDGAENMAEYSQSKLVSLAYSLIHLTPEKKLEGVNSSELVDGETATQIIIFTENNTIRLYLGRKCPVDEGYYLKNEAGEVFLISSETAELIGRPTEDYRNLSLFPALSGGNISVLTALRITNDRESITLRQIQGGTVSTFYAMTDPVEAVPDWENVYKDILDPLFALTPEHFVANGVNLADYGFSTPDYILELLIDGRVHICGFVKKDADTYYCAELTGSLVSEIPAEKLDFLSTNSMRLIGSSIYSLSAADTASVSAKYDGGSLRLEISGFSETLSALTESRQLDATETTKLFSQLVSVPAVRQLDGSETPSDEVLLTLTFEKRNSETDILEFRPVNGRQCAVFINGKAEFATYTSAVKDIIEAAKTMGG